MSRRAAVLLTALMVVSSSAMGLSSEVEFCQFPLSDRILNGNITFGVFYSFDIDADGHPVNVKALRDDYIAYDDVAGCLSRWKFLGFPSGTSFVVFFNWKHGVGWDSMVVSGPEYRQAVRVTGVPPYYARPRKPWEHGDPEVDQRFRDIEDRTP